MATGEEGPEYSPEEERLMRFRYENQLTFDLANLGIDMNELQVGEAGKELIQAAIDTMHNSMLELIETDLSLPRARDLQVQARAGKLLVDQVMAVLEKGKAAVFQLADLEEDEHE